MLNESADQLESTGTMLSPPTALITWALSGGRAAQKARFKVLGGPKDISKDAARVAVMLGSIALGQAGGGGGGGPAVRWVDPRTLRPTHGGLTRNVIDKLARSMRKGGYDVSKPIEALEIEGSLYIRDGHHRAVAAARAGLSRVPVLISQPSSQAAAEAVVRDFIRTLSDSGIRGP